VIKEVIFHSCNHVCTAVQHYFKEHLSAYACVHTRERISSNA